MEYQSNCDFVEHATPLPQVGWRIEFAARRPPHPHWIYGIPWMEFAGLVSGKFTERVPKALAKISPNTQNKVPTNLLRTHTRDRRTCNGFTRWGCSGCCVFYSELADFAGNFARISERKTEQKHCQESFRKRQKSSTNEPKSLQNRSKIAPRSLLGTREAHGRPKTRGCLEPFGGPRG